MHSFGRNRQSGVKREENEKVRMKATYTVVKLYFLKQKVVFFDIMHVYLILFQSPCTGNVCHSVTIQGLQTIYRTPHSNAAGSSLPDIKNHVRSPEYVSAVILHDYSHFHIFRDFTKFTFPVGSQISLLIPF